MKTDDLIRALASDLPRHAAPAWSLGRTLALGMTGAAVVMLGVLVSLFSRSPHLAHGLQATALITAATGISLAAGAAWIAVAAARPDGAARLPLWPLVPAPILLVAGIVSELTRTPEAAWHGNLMGSNPLACFLCVVALSLPVLVVALFVLRRGASLAPRAEGALAGALAGGVAMALYVIHCPENSLLFIAAWHVPAVLLVVALGALSGGRLLRW